MITFYDLASKDSLALKSWSLNSWKVRYVLNMKNLPYRTVYLELPDIERVSKEVGIGPSRVKPDGTPLYTCPAIFDGATGAAISDSYKIAEYLDKQYPDTPKAFPEGTEVLQAAFYHYFNDKLFSFVLLFVDPVPALLPSDSSKEYYSRTRGEMFGKPVGQTKPVGEELEKTWEKATAFFDLLANWYGKSSGPFLVGDQVSFGDFTVVALVQIFKIICGESSEEWEKIQTLNNGRWIKLLSDLEKYADGGS